MADFMENSIKTYLESYGKHLFNSNSFSYPVMILGGESTNQHPTVEVGAYFGIIYKDDLFHLYRRKVASGDTIKWSTKRISTHKTLFDASRTLMNKLLELKSEEFLENEQKANRSKVFSQGLRAHS